MKTLWVIAALLAVAVGVLLLIGVPVRSGFSIRPGPEYPPIIVTNVAPVPPHEH